MSIFSLIFPRRCAGCGEFAEGVFCELCAAKYEQIKRVPCRRCGAAHSLCRCKPEKLAGERGVSTRHLFAFEGETARSLVYKLKRKNLSALQKFFAAECASLIREEMRRGEEYIVTYVPRAKKSVREYGFDQAQILAREAAKALGLPAAELFLRERGADVQQKTLGAKEREQNAACAYTLCEDADAAGKTVVILDDVTTTGSTAKSLCRLAYEAGAKRVLLVTVAKT
ncbi:MAG: ComF family protein [Clostridia bacterium]|nr:ComF family protein [Clostridia bacterium]